MIGFLRKYWSQIILIVLLLAQVGQAALLRQALSNERIDVAIQRAVNEAAHLKQPVNVTVTPPGETRPLNVVVQPPTIPGGPVIVQAPPVLCRTEEECRRIYGAAQQTITVSGEVALGTIVPVCLVDLVNNVCPPASTANRPLARGMAFKINVVRLEGGAFTTVMVPGSPLRITQVETSTKPLEVAAANVPLPYNLGLGVRLITPMDLSRTVGFVGPLYQNYGWGGIYEVGIGLSTAGWAASFGYTLPLR
jgi:hypothetical protein